MDSILGKVNKPPGKGQIQPAACFCIARELRIIFLF